MNNFEDVIANFKKADTQQRLELYMQYRELRKDFDQIENSEPALNKGDLLQIVIEPSKTDNQQSIFVRMKRLCCSILS
jgi:hypothetical protein